MTRVIFVRHGQSQANLERLFTGRKDVDLTELGRKQAEKTAELLSSLPIDRIYSSPLKRAIQTAEPTAKRLGLPIIREQGLIELDAGDWEGLVYEELLERYPVTRRLWLDHPGLARPDGGESIKELSERSISTVDRLVSENRGGCIVLFSHDTPALALYCHWMGRPVEKMDRSDRVTNASVTVVDYADDGSTEIRAFSYDRHLKDLS